MTHEETSEQSARAAARPESKPGSEPGQRKDKEPELQIITFKLEQEHYGIDILCVEEIVRLTRICPMPHTPPFIRGVLNLRGNIISVVDLREFFNFEVSPYTYNTRIVITCVQDKRVGLIVDAIMGVSGIEPSLIDETPTTVSAVSTRFIQGVTRISGALIILLDLPMVIFSEKMQRVGAG